MGVIVASFHDSGKAPVSHSELNIAKSAFNAGAGSLRSISLWIESGPSETLFSELIADVSSAIEKSLLYGVSPTEEKSTLR